MARAPPGRGPQSAALWCLRVKAMTLRLSDAGHELIAARAHAAGVSLAAFVREAAYVRAWMGLAMEEDDLAVLQAALWALADDADRAGVDITRFREWMRVAQQQNPPSRGGGGVRGGRGSRRA